MGRVELFHNILRQRQMTDSDIQCVKMREQDIQHAAVG